MQTNYDLPLADKIVWSAACIGILIVSPFLCVAELLWDRAYHNILFKHFSVFQDYDNEVLSMWSTLKDMWVGDDDDFDYGAYA